MFVDFVKNWLASAPLKAFIKSNAFLSITLYTLFCAFIPDPAVIIILASIIISILAIFYSPSFTFTLLWLDIEIPRILKTLVQIIYIKTKALAKDLSYFICYNCNK